MAGRPKKIRSIQSYINNIDNNTFSGPMKMGTAPSIGVTRNYWYNYVTQCNTNPNAVKKSYNNMVFLNINPAQTPVSAGFRPTTNYNYSYNAPPGVGFYDADVCSTATCHRGTVRDPVHLHPSSCWSTNW